MTAPDVDIIDYASYITSRYFGLLGFRKRGKEGLTQDQEMILGIMLDENSKKKDGDRKSEENVKGDLDYYLGKERGAKEIDDKYKEIKRVRNRTKLSGEGIYENLLRKLEKADISDEELKGLKDKDIEATIQEIQDALVQLLGASRELADEFSKVKEKIDSEMTRYRMKAMVEKLDKQGQELGGQIKGLKEDVGGLKEDLKEEVGAIKEEQKKKAARDIIRDMIDEGRKRGKTSREELRVFVINEAFRKRGDDLRKGGMSEDKISEMFNQIFEDLFERDQSSKNCAAGWEDRTGVAS